MSVQLLSRQSSFIRWAALLIVGACGCVDPATESVSFQKTKIDCGVVSAGTPVYAEFKFSVNQEHPVEIQTISRSCECMEMHSGMIDKLLEPSSSHSLTLSLETSDRAGPISGTAIVEMKPPWDNQFVLQLVAFVKDESPRLIESPPILSSGATSGPHEVAFSAEFRRPLNSSPVEWLPLESNLEGFVLVRHDSSVQRIEASGNESDDSYRDVLTWTFAAQADLDIGKHKYELSLGWEGTDSKLSVPIVVNVLHPIQASSDRIFLGEMAPQQEGLARIAVTDISGAGCRLKEVRCDIKSSEVQFDETNSEVLLTVTAPRNPGRFQGNVTISPYESSHPDLLIPVSGIVREKTKRHVEK